MGLDFMGVWVPNATAEAPTHMFDVKLYCPCVDTCTSYVWSLSYDRSGPSIWKDAWESKPSIVQRNLESNRALSYIPMARKALSPLYG